jgi:hypothetical protein
VVNSFVRYSALQGRSKQAGLFSCQRIGEGFLRPVITLSKSESTIAQMPPSRRNGDGTRRARGCMSNRNCPSTPSSWSHGQKADLNPNYELWRPSRSTSGWEGIRKWCLCVCPRTNPISSGDTLARRANPARTAAVLERAENSKLDL